MNGKALGGTKDTVATADFIMRVSGTSDFEIKNANLNYIAAQGSQNGLFSVGQNAQLTFSENGNFSNNTANGSGAILTNYGTVLFQGDDTVSFNNNTSVGNGGAVLNNRDNNDSSVFGKITFENEAVFDGNSAAGGGAIYNNGEIEFKKKATFTNNSADKGAAIYSNSGTIIFADAEFNNNTATSTGIIYGSSSSLQFNNLTFSGNTAKDMLFQNGGTTNILGNFLFANNTSTNGVNIYNSGTFNIQNTESPIEQVKFYNNTAASSGGALSNNSTDGSFNIVSNTIEFDKNSNSANYGGAIFNASTMSLLGNTNKFTNNVSTATGSDNLKYGGGAIYNRGTDINMLTVGANQNSQNIFSGNEATLNGGAYYARENATAVFNGTTTFSGNKAGNLGGAVFNRDAASVITFNGNTVFSQNTDSTGLNDIYNNGTITFNGDVTLDGGISGSGIVTFAEGTSLRAELQKTTILANTVSFEGNNQLNLTVANGLANADYDFIAADTLDGNANVTIADNAIYNLKLTDEGKINVSVKSGEEIAKTIDVPVTNTEAQTLSAVIASNGNGTSIGNKIANAISAAMQGNHASEAIKAVQELAPTTSQQVMGVAQGVNNVLSNVTGNRMSAMGRAGGDAFIGGALWAQGLYNHTKQDDNASSDGFTANTRGFALGIDGKVNQAVTLGLGYGYTNTNADAAGKDIDVDGHNFFAYAQYQPDAWYINGMIGYSLSKYTEEKSPMGIAMKSKYDVNTYSANLTTGYDFANGITPHIGLRYILAKQDGYNDGAQYIKSDDNDLLTGVLGVKYSTNIKAKDLTFAPNIRLAATYDFISDNSVANVNVIGGGNYQITGERLKRFGVETGVGLETTYGDWNLSLDYNGSFKKDYQSHTGMLKAKYNF